MKVLKNYLWNIGYQVFILLVPLITVPYINRVLGPTGVGASAFTNSVVQYFILLGSLGINLYGSRGTAYVRDDPDKLSRYFWELAILRFVFIGISTVVYLIFIWQSSKYRLFYLGQGIALIGTALDISWFFQGLENFKVTVLRSTFVKIVSVVFIFALVRNSGDTLLYICILAGSQFLGNLTFWPYLKKYVHHLPKLRQLDFRQHIAPSIAMLIPQLAIQIYVQLNKTMLGFLVNVTASGFYDNSDKIVKMLLAVVTATGTVMLPHVANNFANGRHDAVKRSLITTMHLILVIAFPLAFGISAVSTTFTYYFFSAKFMPVANLMAVEAIVVIPIAIGNAIGVQYFLPTNRMKDYTTSVILGSVVNIILNIPLILMWHTMGAIVSTVIAESVVTAYQIFTVRKDISIKSLFAEVWKYFAAGLLMFIFVKTVDIMLGRSVLTLVADVLVGIIVYAGALLLLRPRIVLGFVTSFIKQRRG